ncbi:MAG: hypothetical protein ABSF48_24805 [Thermodesulfobacteriota bacterium]
MESRVMKEHSVILILAFLLLAGCSTVTVESKLYPGVPVYAPIDLEGIEILLSEPDRPYQKFGEIYLQPNGNPSPREILKKFKKAAAKMGADAVILVADKYALTGGPVAGPEWWNPGLSGRSDRIIIGVAIWFPEPQGKILRPRSPAK